MLEAFFRPTYTDLVREPNGKFWWHHLPLPDGTRIAGANADPDYQRKMWAALGLRPGELAGKSVLDVGANDGYFTLAALAAGAARATAINSDDWDTYPHNLRYGAARWDLAPDVLVGDFRTFDFPERYDVIFFFGVLYHLEDVFTPVRKLGELLKPNGAIYIESQMTKLAVDLPVWEAASDIYPSVVYQNKRGLSRVGLSNYLFPNTHAVRNLAYSYDFECEDLLVPGSAWAETAPNRGIFKFTRS